MLSVDARRMFTTAFFYIMLGIAVAVPILILVMTTMMDGAVSVDPNTGKETVIEAFDYVWQIIGSVSTAESSGMSMDMMSMCNINLLYFGVAVLITMFISADFRSGYAKNLFAVRATKSDYVISKTIVGFIASAILVVGFFLGTVIGGSVAGLPFTMVGFNTGNLVMCMLSKVLFMAVFVPMYVLAGVAAKQKTWLGMALSLSIGMLLFMMIPMLTPLDAGFMNVVLCLAGGVLFSTGLGAISRTVLKKMDIR